MNAMSCRPLLRRQQVLSHRLQTQKSSRIYCQVRHWFGTTVTGQLRIGARRNSWSIAGRYSNLSLWPTTFRSSSADEFRRLL